MSSIYFRSTNQSSPVVNLREALLKGQAPDKGLYMPSSFPPISEDEMKVLQGKPYWEVAFTILRRFVAEAIPWQILRSMCEEVYDFEVPLEFVKNKSYVMRLDQGPTASFKDFAARMMGKLISYFVRADGTNLTILTATSGDTGSAIAHAFFGLPNIRIVVLFPIEEVSLRQRKQMTTIGKNVTTIAIQGKFDDCQAIVKQAFADPELASMRLSSANSINIGRLLPQSVYYVYAYVQLAKAREPIIFSVPSGNFGDLMGGLLAKKMGIPICRFVVATNSNDEVPLFFASGNYEKISPSRVCISNAMNVGHPSNLARLVDLYGGQMDETGKLIKAPEIESIRKDLFSVSIDDEQTRRTILEAYKNDNLLLEPHGAVGWAGLKRLFEAGEAPLSTLSVSISTAHPAKFPEAINTILGIDPSLPPSLQGFEAKHESYISMPVDYMQFREWLKKQAS